ncbi:RNA degradosome polyphosphate kinase [Jeotgalibacillus haloalkalitolerans]|uniref:Polyphosphate kinase n=1 Tax=Jeotgalibacillus haloalkalitolerans TaxID=3104292 RepID=A0ABU5KQ96_9BACL|nr:RNA degradosome polyphosphate kinase [Jeotgalibacillus sp. HH7-29]MDZ5712921.1 RNA degradosome polyphosphate kinase [Jeotgalibacillus sp. HH7-29]
MGHQDKKFSKPEYFNNRELSWLAFNQRVLEESFDMTNPMLERLRFLSIFSSNLDEFYMVRVAGLKDQVKANFTKPENKAGLTPKQQLSAISEKTHHLVKLQYQTFTTLKKELGKEDISFRIIDDLSSKQLTFIEHFFKEQVFPVLTPLAVDAYRPFPILLNKSLNIMVELASKHHEKKVAIVQVPSVLPRYIRLPSITGFECILLEDVIKYFLNRLFVGYQVNASLLFRITRNADLTIHEEGARDLLLEIEKELKKRKWGAAVRLEIEYDEAPPKLLAMLSSELEIEENDIYTIRGPLDLTFLFDFIKNCSKDKDHLIFESFIPQPPGDLQPGENIFDKALKRDLFFHHPYESFNPIVDFIDEAAEDPDVLAIKQTLYRVSGGSPIINALKKAAENGKQVTVLVELKARFDEENNVQWAKELEKAGCHVIYGMTFLKTHSKITLIVRKKDQKIERFVHLGTGNYNDQTAKIYTDMGIITTKRKFGTDATNFFNYLSGYTEKPSYHHLIVAPFSIRDSFIGLIDHEISFHKKHKNGHIIAKMNSLTDKPLIMKFYEASAAGVKVDLIIRGICCLRPGVEGVSENISVRSIVGRFLEHSRIYYFHHNGEEKCMLSSADMMTRNMDKRVELLFPVTEQLHKDRVKRILDLQLADNMKARVQDKNGIYTYIERNDKPEVNAQKICLMEAYRITEGEE